MIFKYLLPLTLALVAVSALPVKKPSDAPEIRIIKNYNENKGDGSFNWGYETSDGSKQEQTSYLKNAGTDKEVRVVTGSYSYRLEDGRLVTVNYISDENGYQPVITYSR